MDTPRTESLPSSAPATSSDHWSSTSLRVLIVTDNPKASQNVVTDLRKIGLDVQLALFNGEKLASVPREAPSAILCFFTDYLEKTPGVCQALRAHFAPRSLPIIGAMMRPTSVPTDHFDTVIFAPMHSSQIANRVDSMIRLGQMETEITRRIETLREDFNQDVELTEDELNRPFRILFIGKATPAFMVVVNALQNKNVEVVAAFTSFSAFDYLHDRQFDAVVMNAITQPEPALTISETMRRNAKLYHVPTLFLIDQDSFDQRGAAYAKGARDLVSVDAELEEISGRILELANYHRIHEQLKENFGNLGGEDCLDRETGLFNEDFFSAHLARVSKDCRQKDEDLTLLALRPVPLADGVHSVYIRAAIAKIGGMLKNLVRMQDIVARVDDDLFMLAFPGASEAIVNIIADRINGLVSEAAFDSGQSTPRTFNVQLDSAIIEQSGSERSDILLGRALSKLVEAQEETPHSLAS